jgi:hypothetical protein
MPTWDEFVDWAMRAASQTTGRAALRRRWSALRLLAEQVAAKLPEEEVDALLGKTFAQLDPEHNDLKALVAYAAGKGIIPNPAQLQEVLREDAKADPLHFLAQHSGKTFGEKFSPMFAEFWLKAEGDVWEKKSSKQLYDVGWFPKELGGKEIRIELKASSEAPGYLFQQIRHPKLSGSGKTGDYDLLLCLGVTAGSLEWWGIPANDLDNFAENGSSLPDSVVITLHHGKRRPIWNKEHGYTDEGWFRADPRARQILKSYAVENSSRLRAKLLGMAQR